MPSANVYNMDGEVVRAEELDGYVFGAPVNTAVLHQVVTAQLTNRRQGNASTKTRADVSGGGKKPYRQKGTGHARQGSTRAPQYRGGGVVFGPHPHAYERKIPRKMARLALRSALSDKAANGRILVMEGLTFEEPRTKDMEALLAKLPLERHVLLLMPERDENVILSSRNIHRIKLCHVSSINVVELLKYDHLMMPPATVERIVEMFGQEADDRIQLKRHPRVVWRRQQRRGGTATAAASTTPEAAATPATPATPEPPAEAEPAEPKAESGTKPSTTRRRSRSQEE
jgi:large subunit ribosomal protein L4